MAVTLNASTSTGLVQSADTSGVIELQSNGTTALTVNTNEGIQILNCLGVGNATPSTSGAGITFPATQSASSDANTLDDYEEGTWTPSLSASGGTVTYFVRVGRYVKIGTQVTVSCYLQAYFSAGAGANSVTIGGLPIVTRNVSNLYQAPSWGQIDFIDWPADAKQFIALSVPNTTEMNPYWAKDDAGGATVKSNEWDNGSAAIILSYTYISE
jgi:hypothetical protein